MEPTQEKDGVVRHTVQGVVRRLELLECDVCGKKATALYGVMCCLSCQEKVGRGVYRQSKRYVYTHRQNPKRERWWQFWRPAWTVEKEEMRA